MAIRRSRAKRTLALGDDGTPIIYIHGIGRQDPADALKRRWDLALFGRDMGTRTRMAYWSDLLHAPAPVATATRARRIQGQPRNEDLAAMLADVGLRADDPRVQALTAALWRHALPEHAAAIGAGPRAKLLPLPRFLREPIARAFLQALVRDSAAYFFNPQLREKIRQRLRRELPPAGQPAIVVAHSQGTVVTLEVLAEAAGAAGTRHPVEQLITLGSPLGLREVQDFLTCPRRVPEGVARWNNFADPLDPVALDKRLQGDFPGPPAIVDELIVNTELRHLQGFNPHSAVGYLAHPKVRAVAQDAARVDRHARFLVARDVAMGLAVEQRQPVLIEVLDPGYPALGESPAQARAHELAHEAGQASLRQRIANAAQAVSSLVAEQARLRVPVAAVAGEVAAARIDPLRRFVAARLTPSELGLLAAQHQELRLYAVWKSARKRKLLQRSARALQVDAARASYGASGIGVRWAVLDTGVHRAHPHFQAHANVVEVWDCTQPGAPKPLPGDRDADGHGTHVAGIIAGQAPGADDPTAPVPRGMAPQAQLIVYKVLGDDGSGEDAWIIKALDHIAEQNAQRSDRYVDGLNLSLGGPFDSTVYGCGFSPICAELRRLWRDGVLVVVAAGNEGQTDVSTPDGEVALNTSLSIGDPANLEECIAVGSVNADRPHLYGVSAFSSRGPTADGRAKPDVVAPGERILSCDARFRSKHDLADLYRAESGTSMAAPHVSGLLAAFLSVRPEFRGRPDEVKAMLLAACTDLGRDRYHQGRGLPNLMRLLTST